MSTTTNKQSLVGERAGRRNGMREAMAGRVVLTLLVAAILAVPLLYRAQHADAVLPGVHVSGIALGGQTPGAALASLAAAGLDPQAPVILRSGDEQWALPPEQSGLAFDARATVEAAYSVGRGGPGPAALLEAVAARLRGHAVAPVVTFDRTAARAGLEHVAGQHDRPALDATVAFEGGAVHAAPAQDGRAIDFEATLAALEARAADGTWPIELELPITTSRPAITDASAAVAPAEALLAAPITVRMAGDTWQLEPAVLGPMLGTRTDGNRLTLTLDEGQLAAWLAPVSEVVSQTARMPRYHFNPATKQLELVEPGVAGQRVDVAATAERILGAADGRRLVPVVTRTVRPAVSNDADPEALGIRELVHAETSYYAGSSAARVHNIGIAAAQFDGLLVAPDTVFSFNEHVGEITEETGFKETLIIMDGATADGVGGGVCQVSTTLFRTAFWSGLPIVERHAHGYRVAYYEQNAEVGLDATIYRPTVDLRFRNDTGHWLLIETDTNALAKTVTFRFYGTKPARIVEMDGPQLSDPVPPPAPRTEVDPSLPPGTTETVELARSGASVTVERIIRQNGQETRETFRSHYRPTGAVTAVGPTPEPPAGGNGTLGPSSPLDGSAVGTPPSP